MELRYLKSFVAVAEDLHFGRAAERLKVAQPALSQHIQKLEASLDARLLDRDRHGVALTAVGQVFLREARSILAQVAHARNEVDRVKAGGQGTLRLAYVPGPARGTLTCALATMRKRSPAIRVELHESGGSAEVLRSLVAGEFDAVLTPEYDPPYPRGLEHVEIARQRVLVAMGRRHPAAKERVVPLRSLRHADWVVYSESLSPGYRRWINDVCATSRFRPRIAQRVRSGGDMQVALASLPGVAILPEGYREFFGEDVAFRPFEPEPDAMGLWLWWRKGKSSPNPAVAAFRDAVGEMPSCATRKRGR